MNKNMKYKDNAKGGTGIYLNANDEEAFNHFLSNSIASYYRRGSNGVIYKLILNPGVESKYLSFDASDFSQPITELLVKITFVCPIKTKFEIKNKPIFTTQQSDFFEEINIQTDVYLKTMTYLQPICPAIVYANIFNANDPSIRNITNDLVSQFTGVHVNVNVLDILYENNIKIGIIGMELMENTKSLFDIGLKNEQFYKYYYPIALQSLIEFVVKTRYNHADFHSSNILINTNVFDYYKNTQGCAKIIDFGYAQKLTSQQYEILNTYYTNRDYIGFLNELCNIKRKDNYDMNDYDDYLYTCLKKNPFTNNQLTDDEKFLMNDEINILFQLREQAKDDLVQTFTEKRLPLGNAEKNKMYQGYIHEQKRVQLKFEFNNQTTITESDFINYIKKRLLKYSTQTTDPKYKNNIKIVIKGIYNYLYVLNTMNIGKDEEMYAYASECYVIVKMINNCLNLYKNKGHADKFFKILLNCSFLQDVYINNIIDYIIPENESEFKILLELLTTPVPYENPEQAANMYKNKIKIEEKNINLSDNNTEGEEKILYSMEVGGKKRKQTYRRKHTQRRKREKTKKRMCNKKIRKNKCIMKGG